MYYRHRCFNLRILEECRYETGCVLTVLIWYKRKEQVHQCNWFVKQEGREDQQGFHCPKPDYWLKPFPLLQPRQLARLCRPLHCLPVDRPRFCPSPFQGLEFQLYTERCISTKRFNVVKMNFLMKSTITFSWQIYKNRAVYVLTLLQLMHLQLSHNLRK